MVVASRRRLAAVHVPILDQRVDYGRFQVIRAERAMTC
jgi:hypothetical protein